jgi:Mce-associated membrane protein
VWAGAALAVALAATLGTLLWRVHDRPDLSGARASALAVAEAAATDVLSYSYRSYDAGVRRAAGLLTPAFRRQYLRLSAREIRPLALRYRAVVTSSVVQGGVCDVAGYCGPDLGPGRLRVLLFVDQVSTDTRRAAPQVSQERLWVSVVETGGHWLVADMSAV